MNSLLLAAGLVSLFTLVFAGTLSLLPRLAAADGAAARAVTRAPGLDLVVASFTWLPWLVAGLVWGGRGVLGAAAGQIVALFAWTALHELAHRKAARGPRIVTFVNRIVGRWRNHAALWVTMVALPGFWFIRVIEIFCWPALVWLLNFPRYNHAEWVNVSRQKFDGLVGHDLLWCLYCDWMTGVYSLGAEMLRNVESFWCPIRFYDGKKCDNCKLDFPDVAHGWVRPEGTMGEVMQVMEAQYGGGQRTWFGHPARLTVRGKSLGTNDNGHDTGQGNGAADRESARRQAEDAILAASADTAPNPPA